MGLIPSLCIGASVTSTRQLSQMTRLCLMLVYFRQFFFFQAEDGIRDVAVTGVQTCALPICQPGVRLKTPHKRGPFQTLAKVREKEKGQRPDQEQQAHEPCLAHCSSGWGEIGRASCRERV